MFISNMIDKLEKKTQTTYITRTKTKHTTHSLRLKRKLSTVGGTLIKAFPGYFTFVNQQTQFVFFINTTLVMMAKIYHN